MNLGRVLTAMVTPFDAKGQVDYAQAQYLAEYLLAHGSDGVVVSGTTGESPTLSQDEKCRLFAAVREAVGNKGLVIAGTSSYNTASSVEFSKRVAALGVDALLAVTPYYNKPPQEGAYQHFAAIAQAVDLPVMLYNVPSRTSFNLLPATVERLSRIENIVALKESTGNMEQMSELAGCLPPDFYIYSGDDAITLPMMSLGCHGVVSVAAHLVGEEIKQMIEAFAAGDTATALELHLRCFPVFRKLFVCANPIPLKYCLNRLGINVGACRLPLCEADAANCAELDSLIESCGLKKLS